MTEQNSTQQLDQQAADQIDLFEAEDQGNDAQPQQSASSQAETPTPPSEHHSPDSQLDAEALIAEAKAFGLDENFIEKLPPEQLDLVMNQFAQLGLGSSPQGMNPGQMPQQGYQQQQQLPPVNPPQQQQAQQAQLPDAPDWDNEELFDPDTANAMKYLHGQNQQLMQQIQQMQLQNQLNEYLAVVDGLNSDVINRNQTHTEMMGQHIALYEQYLNTGRFTPQQSARMALRSLNISSNEELKEQAKQRSSQFASRPARAKNGQFQSPEQIAQAKLDEFAAEGGDRSAFLD